MQRVSSRIWTRVAVSIFYDDNHYTTDTIYAIQWMNATHFFIKISLSHFILERVNVMWCVWDGWRDIYSERGLLLSISSSRSQGGANACTPLQARQRQPDRLRVLCSTAILCTLSKSDRVVLITWSPSGYTPVRPECLDALSSSYLLIKMWQITKAHGVTRNELKIHGICYITFAHC